MNGRALKNDGFTLIEMMIAIALFSVVIGAAYTLFNSQQKTHTSQLAMVDVQQDLRAGMGLMVRDVRLAGYDECIGTTAGAGFTVASESQMAFTMSIFDNFDGDGDGLVDEWDEAGSIAMDGLDNDGDGIVDGYSEVDWAGVSRAVDQAAESVTYGFNAADDANDDGIADAGAARFGRTDGSGVFNVLMENVHAVAFAYAFDDDDDGFIDLDAGGDVIWGVDSDNDQDLNVDISGTAINPNVSLDNIRAVQIWVLARSDREESGFLDTRTYNVGSSAITPGDLFRRRLLTATVLCKNMH
jgi:type IV pilus assembly protein PilW